MRRDLVLAALWIAGGCSVATSSTVPHVRFGYDRPVRISLAVQGGPQLLDGWRTALRTAGTVEIVTETALEDGSTHARMCNVGLDLARRGTPVELVVELVSSIRVVPNVSCSEQSRFWRELRSEPEPCPNRTYLSTTATATTVARILDATTCTPIRTHVVSSVQTSSVNEREAAEISKQLAIRLHLDDLRAAVTQQLFPHGLAIASVSGRTIEVSRRGDRSLASGAVYVLRTPEMITPNRRATLAAPRIRVAALSSDRATLEVDQDSVGVRAGDQLRAHRNNYLFTLYGAPVGSLVRDDAKLRGGIALAVAFRTAAPRVPLFAEVEAASGAVPTLDSSFLGGGVAVGVRWPVGSFVPIALLEVGGLTLHQRDLADRAASSTRGYAGVGVGGEVWLGGAFVMFDARYRRLANGNWETTEENMQTAVDSLTASIDVFQLRIAAGYRF